MLKELSRTEFQGTFGKKMLELQGENVGVLDIWPYVQQLVRAGLINDSVYENQWVETVYRTVENTYDHILLPTEKKNSFMLIVVDLIKQEVHGHHFLDLNEEYGIE